jgi:hypothetical protein
MVTSVLKDNPARRALALLGVLGLMAMGTSGCATYTDHVREAKQDALQGRTQEAVGRLNKAIGAEESHQYPDKLTSENTLMLLERATLLQAVGKYKLAARDMMIADQQLDWLDIGAQGKAKIGKYMFSGSSVKYRAPPYERLLLNTLNMVNFMAIGDYEGAQVEARRFSIVEYFFVNDESKTLLPESLALGNYLGGVAFEATGEYNQAARYYADAYRYGLRTSRFRQRLIDLFRITGYGGKGKGDAVAKLVEASRAGSVLSFEEYRRQYVDGELLMIVQSGMVPYKEGKKYPVGQAIAYANAHSYNYNYTLSASERSRARELAVSGALKWISFPQLTEKGLPGQRDVNIFVDGREAAVFMGSNIERQVEHAWERISGALMVAAITRMITRAAMGAGAREATEEASGSGGLGLLAQLAVEGSMLAADKPDTRSWSMLPGQIKMARVRLPEGSYPVKVRVAGRTETRNVEIGSGVRVVNFSRNR